MFALFSQAVVNTLSIKTKALDLAKLKWRLALILGASILTGNCVQAQESAEKEKHHGLSVNFADGHSAVVAGYEWSIPTGIKQSFVASSFGIGYSIEAFSTLDFDNRFVDNLTVPARISFNYGKEKHFLELGMAASYVAYQDFYSFSPLIGYRFRHIKLGSSFRLFVQFPIGEHYRVNLLSDQIRYSYVGIGFVNSL